MDNIQNSINEILDIQKRQEFTKRYNHHQDLVASLYKLACGWFALPKDFKDYLPDMDDKLIEAAEFISKRAGEE
jgi:mRNA-degrading endonuclease HigB of HigAB toxin-antitoxin module